MGRKFRKTVFCGRQFFSFDGEKIFQTHRSALKHPKGTPHRMWEHFGIKFARGCVVKFSGNAPEKLVILQKNMNLQGEVKKKMKIDKIENTNGGIKFCI